LASVVVVAACIEIVLLRSDPASSFTLIEFTEPPLNTNPAGIVAGQTARLGVANTLDQSATPAACATQMAIFDEKGAALKAMTEVIGPGEMKWMDFELKQGARIGLDKFRGDPTAVERRLELRGLLVVIADADPRCQSNLVGSFQVINNTTGQTELLVPAVQQKVRTP